MYQLSSVIRAQCFKNVASISTSVLPRIIDQGSLNKPDAIRYLRTLEIKEAWNPGKFDIEAMLKSGIVEIYQLQSAIDYLGFISVFRNQNFSFLGSFIVPSEVRSQGYGQILWKYALDHLNGTTGLYANPVMQDYYAKFGFKRIETIRRISFVLPEDFPLRVFSRSEQDTFFDLKDVQEFDYLSTGIHRGALLHQLQQNSVSSTSIKNGYGFIRELVDGFRLTLYAGSSEDALRILELLLVQMHMKMQPLYFSTQNRNCVIDVPSARITYVTGLLESCKLRYSILPESKFELPFMVRTQQHSTKNHFDLESQTYGLASLEVG